MKNLILGVVLGGLVVAVVFIFLNNKNEKNPATQNTKSEVATQPSSVTKTDAPLRTAQTPKSAGVSLDNWDGKTPLVGEVVPVTTWKVYNDGTIVFKYPSDWKIEKVAGTTTYFLYSPSRTDITGYVGIPVHYKLGLSESGFYGGYDEVVRHGGNGIFSVGIVEVGLKEDTLASVVRASAIYIGK